MKSTSGEGTVKRRKQSDDELPDYILEALRERKWAIHSVDEGVRIVAENSPQYKEYVEWLERITDLLKVAAKELVEEAEREGKHGDVEARDRQYPACMGPVKLSARVEHVERDGKKYAVVEAKYGDRVAKVELDVKKYWRSGLLVNLAAIATDDTRDFYRGYISHNTTSYVQAAERLLMWAPLMPGEYKITVRYIYATEDGLSPYIEIESRFGPGGIEKIKNEPIHRLVLRLARELAGRENLLKVKGAVNKILAASWLMISVILNAPDGKKPSEGLAVLAKKGVLPRVAFDRLKPIFEGLDRALGTVSRIDKVQLVGKLVDYDGTVDKGLLRVSAKKIKEMTIELGGVEIRMADLAEAAAKAFWKKGRWSGSHLSFGPARKALELKVDGELKVPVFKAMAVLITREARKEADELRRKELVKYVELRRYEINGGEIKIAAAKAREESVQITRLEEIWKESKIGKYTHLRLVVRGEEYELLYSGGIFQIRGEGARKLAERLKELGLDVKLTPSGYLYLRYERLEELLDKGVMAYAVRKAKKGEAMWRLEITYRGMTMLEMTYHKRDNRLVKESGTGKIEVFVREEGAAEIKRVKLDLDLLAAAGRDCDRCLEKWLAEALNATASKKGFRWSVTGKRKKVLCIYLPRDFRDVVRRFYSN